MAGWLARPLHTALARQIILAVRLSASRKAREGGGRDIEAVSKLLELGEEEWKKSLVRLILLTSDQFLKVSKTGSIQIFSFD